MVLCYATYINRSLPFRIDHFLPSGRYNKKDKCRYLHAPFVANSTQNVAKPCRISSTNVQQPPIGQQGDTDAFLAQGPSKIGSKTTAMGQHMGTENPGILGSVPGSGSIAFLFFCEISVTLPSTFAPTIVCIVCVVCALRCLETWSTEHTSVIWHHIGTGGEENKFYFPRQLLIALALQKTFLLFFFRIYVSPLYQVPCMTYLKLPPPRHTPFIALPCTQVVSLCRSFETTELLSLLIGWRISTDTIDRCAGCRRVEGIRLKCEEHTFPANERFGHRVA